MGARFMARLRQYLSGKLILVQIASGCGAFAARSLAVYLSLGSPTWTIVLASVVGGGLGYVGTYALGYWFAFRADYRVSGRSMPLDVAGLQFVEQLPNILTVTASVLTQGALIAGTNLPPVVAANVGSIVAPHKIVNLATMLASNSLKKACVDRTWKPAALLSSYRQMPARLWRAFAQRLFSGQLPEVNQDAV
jgi:hypothetical protein